MNLSANGQSQVPPGFRFHPTEEELLQYYLKKKVASHNIDLDIIQDIDLNKLEPWDIQEKCRIGSVPQNDWYFFSHKDKKYPSGTRTNRATRAGFWKATGRDKVICSSSMKIGMRKTLVFYMGRAPHGEKSDWIMHEYRLHDITNDLYPSGNQANGAEEGWVICRVFRKKNFVKDVRNPTNRNLGIFLDTHVKIYDTENTTTTKEKSEKKNNSSLSNMNKMVPDGFLHLPQLDSPTNPLNDQIPLLFHQDSEYEIIDRQESILNYSSQGHQNYYPAASTVNWVELDRLVANQLNGQATESTKQFSCFSNHHYPISDTNNTVINACTFQDPHSTHVFESEANDDQFWSFTKQSSSSTSLDPICHFSV